MFFPLSSRDSSFKAKASHCLLAGSNEKETLVSVLPLNVCKEARSEEEKDAQSPNTGSRVDS